MKNLETSVGSRLLNSGALQDIYQTSTLWGSVSLLSGVLEPTREKYLSLEHNVSNVNQNISNLAKEESRSQIIYERVSINN
jgi:hypothetical protein